jgi:hypothetical protein
LNAEKDPQIGCRPRLTLLTDAELGDMEPVTLGSPRAIR